MSKGYQKCGENFSTESVIRISKGKFSDVTYSDVHLRLEDSDWKFVWNFKLFESFLEKG